MTLTRLDWDSAFFGVEIGRADAAAHTLAEVVREATERGVVCVYLESATPLADDRLDLRLVDRRVVFERAAAPAPPETAVRNAEASDRPRLDSVLDRLAPWSRFARDPSFGVDAARRMYAAWLDRSLSSPDESVGVIDHDGVPAGLVTLDVNDSDAEIGLIGVTTNGAGHGRRLVEWAMATAAPRPVRVATQDDNTRAIVLYERCGFARISEAFVYHLWLNDNESHG